MLIWESVAVVLAEGEQEDEFERFNPPGSGEGGLGGVSISETYLY